MFYDLQNCHMLSDPPTKTSKKVTITDMSQDPLDNASAAIILILPAILLTWPSHGNTFHIALRPHIVLRRREVSLVFTSQTFTA